MTTNATVGERLHLAWKALPYQGRCACATCGTDAYCCGVNTVSRVCESCFTGVHQGRAPNYRRQKKPSGFSSSITAAREGGRKKEGAMTVLAEPSVEELALIPLTDIYPAKDNVRGQVGDVDELAASIKTVGLLEPLIVCPNGKGYVLVAGARRYAAAKKAGLDRAPAIVRDYDEPTRVKVMLIENLQREDLTAVEEARAYQRLVGLGVTQRELAEQVGRSQAHVSKRLALLELPKNVQHALDSGGITLEDAAELAKLKTHPARLGSVFKRRGQTHMSIAHLVSRELQEVERDEKIAAAEAKLAKQGVRVIKLVQRDSIYLPTLPKGAIRICKGGSWNALNLDPAEHKTEPCHAAAVDGNGDVIHCCTDRSRHPKAKTHDESNRGGSKTSPQRREHDKAMREATKARRAFLAGLIAKPPAGDVAFDQVVLFLLQEVWQDARQEACKLLEIDTAPYEQVRVDGLYRDKYELALRDRAQQRGGAQRVVIALMLAKYELSVRRAYQRPDQGYFQYLQERGYQLAPAEKLELAGKAPRP